MSRQKYSYLPMAHNDFIFAVIGEELGFVGTVLVLAAFLFLLYLGYRIAQQASDLQGRLSASGCVTMMMIQLLINTSGVLGIIPLSGKPIPFLSYGGSSIIMNLMLVGLVLSVARHSDVTQTSREERRSSFRVYDGRGASGFRVLSGGVSTTPESLRESRDFASAYGDGRISTNTNGTRRIDLGPSPSDRLRGRGASRGGRE
jgi:cell division protein FtsW